jgi:hypothetical protein
MKIVLGLFIGLVIGVFATVYILSGSSTVKAQDAVSSEEAVSENSTGGEMISLLPDVKGIYLNCLGSPFREVEDEITDPEIANYYHKLMQETGLDQVGLNP